MLTKTQYKKFNGLRVIFFLSSLVYSGGVNVVVEYANHLTNRGHHISLVVPGGTVDPRVQKQLDPTIELFEASVKLSPKHTPIELFRTILSMAQVSPLGDILIATHTPTVIPTLLVSYLQQSSKTIWLYQDFTEMFRDRPVETFLLKHAPKWFSKIAVISKSCQDDIRHNTHVDAVLIGEGLSRPELFFDQPRLLNPIIKKVMYVGDSRPRKGLSEFIKATELVYQKLPNIRLVIISKESCHINTQVPFDFYKFPSRSRLAELYANSHIFVSASWAEGLGLPPLEAMACGTPVVLTNSGGVLDYAIHEENCLIVPSKSPLSMAEAIYRILTDEKLANYISQNGPSTAKKYTWEAAVNQFENMLLHLA